MAAYLGVDTSNYTTSAAIYLNGKVMQQKKLLPVPEGAVGLRQSDAVFAHVKQLGPLLVQLLAGIDESISAVGVSVSPRDEAGSYMPCFLAGKMAAESIAAALHIPLYTFSHQAGHIAAALYDTGSDQLFQEEFLAFHISGGTTQCLLVRPADPFLITTVACSLDLHAGQVIDRVGAMLGLAFPAGPALEELATKAEKNYKVNIAFKGMDCCLSGVENRCAKLLEDGVPPSEIAKYCLSSIESAILGMTTRAQDAYPGRRLVYAGGVMSNKMIRNAVASRFEAAFASPAFSADNAAGVAVLAAKKVMEQR